jgi:DHA1 family bicyclomycin/chloramphenicol resistance-like MFS transporter
VAAAHRTPLPLMVLLAACTALGPLAINIYLPSLPVIQGQFGIDIAALQSTVSLALVAFGLGLLLLGPLADRYGRRPALLAGLVLFILGSALTATADGLTQLLAGRMIASLGAALTFITSRAVVADITPREHTQRSIAQMTMIMLMAQMTAPILGNIALASGSWRAIQYAQLLLGVVLLALVYWQVRETLAERPAGEMRRGLLAPAAALLRRRRFQLLMGQTGLLYSAYPAFVSIAPYLMISVFHRPPTEYGLYFISLPLGYFLGNGFVLRFGMRHGQHRLIQGGTGVGVIACALCLLLFALGLRTPAVLFATVGTLLNFGMGLALPSASARAVSESWPNTGSGWGLVGFSQQFAAAAAVQLVGFFPATSAVPVVCVCMLITALVLGIERWSSAGSQPV